MPEPILSNDNNSEITKESSCNLELKERIIDSFIERVKKVGVRAVSTDEMAKTLSISKKTLYKQFRSKEELVASVLDRWAESLGEPFVISIGENPKIAVLNNVATWYDNDATFCEQFWFDAGEDYPALKAKYYGTMFENAKIVAEQLTQFKKACYSDDFLREAYFLLVMRATEKSFYVAAKLDRREAVLKAVSLWLDGAFDLPEIYNGEQS
ncbi:MAG: TetR/AcrR family transcriptional regulator [Cellvibrionaceae bacterium]